MALRLYNTLTRKKEEFRPIEPGKVRLYTCGPTVYNYAHIGNLRSYIFADILRRTLEYLGHEVTQVMNVTDVGHLTSDADQGEDKMEVEARKEGRDIWEVARYYEKVFFDDIEKLNVQKPAIVCRATDHIPDMIELVTKLVERGHVYETEQALYYDITTFPSYTQLSRQLLDDKIVGARDEVQEDPGKRHPADFAVWFKCVGRFANHIMRWESPWGVGFPGWHIECSAMSMKYLGNTLDIHTGGEDHIHVHHPNEIAQSEGATGEKFVRVWMHGAFLVLGKSKEAEGEQKMAKSTGNFLRLQTLIDNGCDPLAYRYMCFSAHYRQKLTFTWDALNAAAAGYRNLISFASRAKQIGGEEAAWVSEYRQRFVDAISDDLNMPQAMAVVSELVREANTRQEFGVLEALYDFDRVLGLRLREAVESTTAVADNVSLGTGAPAAETVESLIREREQARAAKNWTRADEIRDMLKEWGIVLEDSPSGTLWRKVD